MTQAQQNRLTMNKVVIKHLDDNAPVWQTLAAFKKAHDELLASVKGRNTAQGTQSQTTTGITRDKSADTEAAVKAVLKLAKNTAAYAIDQDNHDLYASLNYSKSYLLNLPDNEQGAFLQTMLDKVRGQVGNLGDYNVTAAAIAEAQSAVDKVKGGMTNPRGAIDTRSTATKSVPAYEADGRKALAKLDRLIHNFEDDAPEFVAQYRQARMIVDVGVRHEGDNSGGGNV